MALYTGSLSNEDTALHGDVGNESAAVILLDNVPVCAAPNLVETTD